MEHPGQGGVGHGPHPLIRDLGPEHRKLEPLDQRVEVVSSFEVQHAHFAVERGEEDHRIPQPDRASDGPGGPRARGERHEHADEDVGREEKGEGRRIGSREVDDRDRRDAQIEQGRDIHGGKPAGPGSLGHLSHPSF